MKNLTAIEIALIPSKDSIEALGVLNKNLFDICPQSFLFTEKKTPHISLLQLFVNKHFLLSEKLTELWFRIGQVNCPNKVELTKLTHLKIENDVSAPILLVKKSEQLLELQKTCHELLFPFKIDSEHHQSEYFFDSNANPIDTQKVNQFYYDSSLENYQPYLTLNICSTQTYNWFKENQTLPKQLQLSELVLTQLGIHCMASSNIYYKRNI